MTEDVRVMNDISNLDKKYYMTSHSHLGKMIYKGNKDAVTKGVVAKIY